MINATMNLESQTTKNTTKRVAIYTRVSTTEQAEEGYSIDEQLRVLREYCNREGYVIHKEYADRGLSGKNVKGRPALQQLLEDAKHKEFDLVLVWKMNRLSRKLTDLTRIEEFLKKSNIAFRSFMERYETETPSGKLQFHMMAAIAEFERDNIAENVKMGMLARAREGSWNGGRVLGYDIVSTSQNENSRKKFSKLVINEREAHIVQIIFEMYTQGHGYKYITGKLNQAGYKTKRNLSFSLNSVKQILQNPLYVGIIRFNVRRDWSEKRRNNINPNPIMQKGTHEPIITQEVWDKTVSIMKSKNGRPSRVHDGEFPLTGMIKCPVCGSSMVISRTTNRKKDGTKTILVYYVCSNWKNKGVTVCRSNGIRADYADKYVLEKIGNVANNNVLINTLVENINKKNSDNVVPRQKEYKSIKKTISSIETKKSKILGLYEDDRLSKEEFSDRFEGLNHEKQALEERLIPIEQELSKNNQIEVDAQLVSQVMGNFSDMYKQSLTREQRKYLLRLLISEITISESRKIDTIKIQFNKEVVRCFLTKEGEKSSIEDDFSPSFSFYIDLCDLT